MHALRSRSLRQSRRPEPASGEDRERQAAAAAALGGLGGLCALAGYVTVFAGLAWEFLVDAAPAIAALGAVGALASGVAWRQGSRSWKTRVGLGSSWLPLAAGVILSIVLIAS